MVWLIVNRCHTHAEIISPCDLFHSGLLAQYINPALCNPMEEE
jgi:hypothetical protein